MQIRLVIMGTPQAKGSRTQIRFGVNIEAGTNASRKRKSDSAKAIELTAKGHVESPLSAPVSVDSTYHFPIPKSRLKGKRKLVPGDYHTQKPDLDKLDRHARDPLVKAGLLKDDCYITSGRSAKLWCEPGREKTELTLTW